MSSKNAVHAFAFVIGCLSLCASGVVAAQQSTRPALVPGSNAVLLAQASQAKPVPQATLDAELDALAKAAKAEGEVLWYSSEPEPVSKRVSEAFTAKYGIKTTFLRGSSAPLIQRFAAEADSNNIAADLVLIAGGAEVFVVEAMKKGWMESLSQAGLPALRGGDFPQRFNLGATAIVQINPWQIAYNTEKVKGADVPKDWPDMLNPKFNGQIILFDPNSSDIFVLFWELLAETYGEQYFTRLRALRPRYVSGGIPASQSLGAGEGAVSFPAIEASMLAQKAKGAPLAVVMPELTAGAEYQIMLTHRAKARHPAAGRLLANYMLSREGNLVITAKDPGALSIYDTAGMPKRYVVNKPGAISEARRERVKQLIGYQ